jgi:hypothetical protein
VPYGGGSHEIRLDQSALHGLLGRIESLGLGLVEIRQLPTSPDDPVAAELP